MRESLLIIGPLLAAVTIAPYLFNMVKGRTKPNITTWLTWTILTAIGTAAVVVEDGWSYAWLPAASCAATLSVVLLGLKYGFAKYGRFDAVCQVAAIAGLGLWFIFDSPLVALVAVIAVDAIAGVPTIRHGWLKPFEETWQTFALGSLASFLTFLGIEQFTASNAAFPLYLMLANAIIAGTIIAARRKVKKAKIVSAGV